MICFDCDREISSCGDNRYRGCDPCGWRMHHACWNEALSLGQLPCGQGSPGYDYDQDDDHGGVIGMRRQWVIR